MRCVYIVLNIPKNLRIPIPFTSFSNKKSDTLVPPFPYDFLFRLCHLKENLVGGNVLVVEINVLVIETLKEFLLLVKVEILVVLGEHIVLGKSLHLFCTQHRSEFGHRVNETGIVALSVHNA